MKQEILRSLRVNQLQQYKRTLKLRIMDLHSFQIELQKQNDSLKYELKTRKQQKPQQVNATSNFNFDDLYKMSKTKVSSWVFGVDKQALKNVYETGKNTIKDVANGASQLVRKTIATSYAQTIPKRESQPYDIQVQNPPCDFRSYQPQEHLVHGQMKRQKHIQSDNDPINTKAQKQQEKQAKKLQQSQQKQSNEQQGILKGNQQLKMEKDNQKNTQQIKQFDTYAQRTQNPEQKSDVQAFNQIQNAKQQFKHQQEEHGNIDNISSDNEVGQQKVVQKQQAAKIISQTLNIQK